jgi:thiol:disulfide interchange protein/DsbC/DsbD-like thiol-disulfide interchange protein
MKRITTILLFFIPLFFHLSLQAEPKVSVSLVSEVKAVGPGSTFWLIVKFDIGAGLHLYWKNPGEGGAPPEIKLTLPSGFETNDIFFPTPARFETQHGIIFGYTNECLLLVPVVAPFSLSQDIKIPIVADIRYFACNESCVQDNIHLELNLETKETPVIDKDSQALFTRARMLLPKENVLYNMRSKEGAVEIELKAPQDPFSEIQRVLFFPDSKTLLDPKILPEWKVDPQGKRLLVSLPIADYKNARGVLVVRFVQEAFQKDLSLKISPIIPKDETPLWKDKVISFLEPIFQQIRSFFSSEFGTILVFAFLGGLILNVMPCVLPVVSLKVFHFLQLKGQRRFLVFKHCFAFSSGIVVSFWILSGAIFALQSIGKTVGWGFQLQEPLFVSFLIVVLFILSMSLFGLFEIGTKVASIAGEFEAALKGGSSLEAALPSAFSSFMSGIFATFIASPCTGPLLGSAIGFASLLHPAYGFAVFTSMGLGMATPYLLFSLFPGLLSIIPKPGRWMMTFKQLMGFFLLGTILWLVWVLEAETTRLSLWKVLLSFFTLAFGLWIWGTWAGFERKNFTRAIAKLVAFIVVAAAVAILFLEVQGAKLGKEEKLISKEEVKNIGAEWEPFSLERLQELRHKRIPVFVDFFAKWCLTCMANDIVFEKASVKEAFVKYKVVKMSADWTNGDETITNMLRTLGRNGVPVFAVYGKNPEGKPKLLPEILTEEIIINALKEAAASE